MSGIRLVESGNDLASGFLEFSELARHLEKRLATCQTAKDLAELIKNIKAYTGSSRYTVEERQELGKIRQRAYDRKRRSVSQTLLNPRQPDLAPPAKQRQILPDISKRQMPDPARLQPFPELTCQMPDAESGTGKEPDSKPINPKEDETMISHSVAQAEKCSETKPQRNDTNFIEGIQRAFSRIDGEALILTLARLILPATFTLLVSYFLWSQSVALYASSGFSNPGMVALGGMIMVMGFAAFHALSRSKLALLCCLYAGGYETYFIASGTMTDERQSKIQTPAVVQETNWRAEQVARTKADYDQKKARFDDPSDKMFQNSWYKTNHVDPAWEKYSAAQSALTEHNAGVMKKADFDHVGWLKILYRLGLVFLCMVLVHKVFYVFRSTPLSRPIFRVINRN